MRASGAGACGAGVSPVRVSMRDRQAHLGDRRVEIALDVDGERLQRRDVERVDAALGLRPDCVSAAPARSIRLGRKPASVLPAPVGAISSSRTAALRLGQKLELVGARRPAAFGEPPGKWRGQDGGADRLLDGFLARHDGDLARGTRPAKQILEQKGISGCTSCDGSMIPGSPSLSPGSTYLLAMRPRDLLHPRPEGLYCPPGDFYIDPVRPVERALITHGHSDHARSGHALGAGDAADARHHGAALRRGLRRHDAGGRAWRRRSTSTASRSPFTRPAMCSDRRRSPSSMAASRIVASGDYKRQADATCAPFEPVACDVFITEATFGLPVFRHPPDTHEIDQLLKSAAAVSRARAPRRRLCARQGAARDQADPRRRLRQADLSSTARWQSSATTTRAQGIALGELAAGDRRGRLRRRLCRRHRRRAAVGLCRPLGAALSRPDVVLRVRLDAHSPARQAGRRRTAADHLRPCRLGRIDAHHRGDRRQARSG